MRLCWRSSTYKSTARGGFHQGDRGCDEQSISAQLSQRDGSKHLQAAREARAGSELTSKRCSVAINHCCVQRSRRAESEERRRGSRGCGVALLMGSEPGDSLCAGSSSWSSAVCAELRAAQRGHQTTGHFQRRQRQKNLQDTLANNDTAQLRAFLLISPILDEAGEGHKTEDVQS